MIWVEFQDGWYFDFDHEVSGVYGTIYSPEDSNLLLKVTDIATSDYIYLGISPRIAGLDPSRNGVVAIHATTRLSFVYPEIIAWPGIFDSGHTYTVQLVDPHFPDTCYTFATPLVITGPNPNYV